jgi:hypothetical protein
MLDNKAGPVYNTLLYNQTDPICDTMFYNNTKAMKTVWNLSQAYSNTRSA